MLPVLPEANAWHSPAVLLRIGYSIRLTFSFDIYASNRVLRTE